MENYIFPSVYRIFCPVSIFNFLLYCLANKVSVSKFCIHLVIPKKKSLPFHWFPFCSTYAIRKLWHFPENKNKRSMNIFHLSKFQKGHWDISGRRKIAPRAKIVTVASIKFLTQSKLYVLKRNIS